ncbi:unnamed protein product [Pseudo-nitzschia multistriata]|uniref:Uncharacterized protein n=1 Tax=Pseudo-nitzschia multistriata TaxID=183589 RepID=A0A448Z3U0_9STRA|nr:unnamed protein product [Pseudo-nitzschia multistriata]
MAILSYCIFADESLKDIVTAVETFPNIKEAKEGDRVDLMIVSSVLRFSQGFLATIVVLLLVVNTPDVVDIVLNFTAVNFVSAFDDVAFELAQWGKYGPHLEAETKRIEELTAPDCMTRKSNYARYQLTIIPVATTLLIMLIMMAYRQDSPDHWLTHRLRVQFEDGTSMEQYSGCYDLDPSSSSSRFWNRRVAYKSFPQNPSTARMSYCMKERRWILYGTNTTDACSVKIEDRLAYSDITYAFGEYRGR